MRAVWITRHGGPETLQVRETDDPLPGAGEAQVQVRACGLSFADVLARQGKNPDTPPPPCVLGMEGAGVVQRAGAGVPESLIGRRVAFLCQSGGQASVVCVPVSQVAELPEAIECHSAAALPVDYLTAHHMLFEVGHLRAGSHVLVHLAASSVGVAILQLCQSVPDVTVYATAPQGQHALLREEGCHHAIDYDVVDYAEEVRRLTRGHGVDLVVDPLGGRDWKLGYSLLRSAGILVACGMANANRGGTRSWASALREMWRMPRYSPLRLMRDNRAVAGVNLAQLFDRGPLLRRQFDALMRLAEHGSVRPRVAAVHPFSRADAGHREVALATTPGKVILVPA
jgi:NADPH:quinone reductase-like Zn-dependent oxidoreductase